MSGSSLHRLAAIAGLGLLLAGCGGKNNEAEIKQYAKKQGFNEIQTAAFSSCAKDLTSNMPILPVPEGNMVMSEVPFDICACQAKTMMTVFKEKRYKGHTNFAVYMATYSKKKTPHISKKDLVPGLKPKEARKQLAESLRSCVNKYVAANEKRSATLFKIVPIKKKPEKKKPADAHS